MGIVRRFASNPVAANMLMWVVLLSGLLVAWGFIPRELFPEFSADIVTVTVPYPGASPTEVEEGIVLKIEDLVSGLDGVKEVTAASREGVGMVTVEATNDADIKDLLDRVKGEVDRIYTFPEDAEEPSVVEVTWKQQVVNVAIAGEASERTLKEIAEEVRDEIADLPEVSQAAVLGMREYEISVEVSEQALRRHSLTLAAVARAIRNSSFDLPAGTVKTRGGEVAIRVIGQRRRAEEFTSIPVLYKPDGTVVRLGEIAAVLESFEDVDVAGQFNGRPAGMVGVFKTPEEDTITIAEAVRQYVAAKRRHLPEGITIETLFDLSKVIKDRLDLLKWNGLIGLGIVFVVLLLFLNSRLSFWVAMGIPFSIFGTILVLHMAGRTLNMISMFALIMALGLIVDDAIVVGENVYAHIERGREPHAASIEGTKEVISPVIGAVVTTWLAFLPLLFISGIMGKIIGILPVAVILALGFSLLECVAILPAHLSHSFRRQLEARPRPGRLRAATARARRWMDARIQGFLAGVFVPVYRLSARFRYVVLAVVLAITGVMGGAFAGGRIQFVSFPKMDSDTLQASLVLPTGTPLARTQEVARSITESAWALNERYRSGTGEPVVQRVYSMIGQQFADMGVTSAGGHVAEVVVELLPSELRGVHSTALAARWRRTSGRPPDALRLTFGSFQGGPGGKAYEMRLLGESTEQCQLAAEAVKDKLAQYPGVTDIEHDALPGKKEMKVTLKPGAHALGVDLRVLATQLRDAFYGNESLKVQRGRDEIKVMVRYPSGERRTFGDVEEMRVRTVTGDEVPFSEVADVKIARGYTTLRRSGRHSVVTVSADIDEDVANAEEVLEDIRAGGFFEDLSRRFGGVKVDFKGQRQQSRESFESLEVWYPLALLGIYTVLAAIFRSYVQPVIVMIVIPFGLVGAVIGHWLFGFDVTLLSMFGMVALTGIVVNDSLVLIDRVNQKIRAGASVHEAVEAGATERFRPIFLTTATTVAGMAPLLAERSFQAQFLKPMVVAIAFGLTFATLLTLLVVPSLYLIGNDARRALRWLRTGRWVGPEDVLPTSHPRRSPGSAPADHA